MDTSIFNKITEELNLGDIIEPPIELYGGLTHKMFKISTNKGNNIVKLLNPNIMKRKTALNNCREAENLEEYLKENRIDAVYYLTINGRKLQKIDGQYFYVYKWYDGKVIDKNEITSFHCKKIGNELSKIHNIDIKFEKSEIIEKKIDFKYYLEVSKENNSKIYDLLCGKTDLLDEFIKKGNNAIKKVPKIKTICHNDLDIKNVLWLENEFKIIDLECLTYNNPYIELFETALCWSGYETRNINYELLKEFLKSYFKNSSLEFDIEWEDIYYANNARLDWLEYNIKRALMIDISDKKEQEIGLLETEKTLKQIIYYKNMKDSILLNFKNIDNHGDV